jgi:hypothetical protein
VAQKASLVFRPLTLRAFFCLQESQRIAAFGSAHGAQELPKVAIF